MMKPTPKPEAKTPDEKPTRPYTRWVEMPPPGKFDPFAHEDIIQGNKDFGWLRR